MSSKSAMKSPNSTASPTVLAPAYPNSLTNISAAGSPSSVQTPTTITSKEWIVPPRPKPGRKPATDTPPTKRKAQNRAAQRAFRERRAARVGELEEHIQKIEEEDEQEQTGLRDQISNMVAELERTRGTMRAWIEKCETLEKELEIERRAKVDPIRKSIVAPERVDPETGEETQADDEVRNVPLGCGNCSASTRCQCIDEAFDIDAESSHPKRPHSPQQTDSTKRIKPEPEELETDFTNAFATAPVRALEVASPTNAIDRCGFCSDGTPCICAEMAAENDSSAIGPARPSRFTPPPSEGDVSNQAGTTRMVNPCVNGPGTCAQCLADPNSTFFCKTLAASQSSSVCCGGSKAGTSECCQTQVPPVSKPKTTALSSSSGPPALNCADVYTTLSRHQAYSKATNDLASWMPKLHARSLMRTGNELKERPAMEIEAASVMSVMRFFDKKYADTLDRTGT